MNEKALKDRLEVAVAAAREAGDITLRYFCTDGYHIERKQDATPVTEADRGSELHLRERISKAFPDDAILGEEFPDTPGTSGYRWILDPIDGTKSFISGVPLYGTLVGVEHERASVIGVIHMPGLDEMVYAAKGQGAWHVVRGGSPQPARVSEKVKLSDGLLTYCELRTFTNCGRGEAFRQLEAASWLTRTWGDCYGYLLVATGRAEAMIDPVMNVWDAGAIQPILEEAGGTFTDWSGQPTIHSQEGIGTNGKVLEEILSITRSATRKR
ncbi:MAG: inositol monophosphatase family protein [Planctomycetia bacterium]|nr:inositol monophosphatase family protein [Planctomycetia bacterium]